MSVPASIRRHPIHPMLIPFPIALWVFSLVADVVASTGRPDWRIVAFYAMAGGLVGAAAAAVPGLVDFWSITDRQTARIARFHLYLNLALVGLYTVNLFLRYTGATGHGVTTVLSVGGVVILGISGWLGGEMVYVRRMGVVEKH